MQKNPTTNKSTFLHSYHQLANRLNTKHIVNSASHDGDTTSELSDLCGTSRVNFTLNSFQFFVVTRAKSISLLNISMKMKSINTRNNELSLAKFCTFRLDI